MSAEFLAWLAVRLSTRAGVLDLVMIAPPFERAAVGVRGWRSMPNIEGAGWGGTSSVPSEA